MIHRTISLIQEALQLLQEVVLTYQDNKLVLVLSAAVAGAILTKLIPSLWSWFVNLATWLGGLAGGRLAYRDFQRRYLDWVVTEYKELRLTGVVTSDDAKKPKLEQVFVSVRVGKEKNTETTNPNERLLLAGRVPTWRDLIDMVTAAHRKVSKLDKEAQFMFYGVERELEKQRMVYLLGKWFRRLRARSAFEIEDEKKRRAWIAEQGDTFKEELAESQLEQILRDQNRVAILGAPGAGKTTLLQYLALSYGRERASDPKLRERGILKRRLGTRAWRLPIFIRLSSVAKMLVDFDDKLRDASIVDILPRILPPDLQATDVTSEFFLHYLKKGKCLLLFDGLDEVPTNKEFEAVVRAIESLCITYKLNQCVITSRIAGWRGGVNADFELFYVNDLSDYQIDTFIDTWYSAVERNAVIGRLKDEGAAERRARERRASQRAEDLKVTLRDNIGIRRLATNPMLLSIIAVVHRGLATLPKERGKLYAQCSKILLEQWDISRGIRVDDTNLKLEQKEAIMRRLAIAFHTGEIGSRGAGREASRSDVQSMIAEMLPRLGRPADEASHLLQMLIERGGIIVERQRGLLAFAHHTFQEYFTAQDLASREQNGAFLLAEGRLLSDWWREVVLLYAGLLSDSSDFIESIYNSNNDELVQPRMRLAALCLVEAVEVRRTEVRELIISALLDIRAPGSIGKLQITPEVAGYLLDWCRDEGWYSAAAIAKVKQTNEVEQVIHEIEKALKHQQSVIRRAAAECVAFLPLSTPDTLVEQLIANLADSDHHVRKNVVEALGSIVSPTNASTVAEHLIEMLFDDDPNVVVSVIRSLFKIRRWLDPDYALLQKVTYAIAVIERTPVGLIAGSILLASANKTIFERFFSEAEGLRVRDLAALLQITKELGGDIRHKLEPDSAASILAEILQDERILSDLDRPESVIGILAEILVHDCSEIVDRLLALATQKKLYVRRCAVNAIAEIATSPCADHVRGKVGQCLATGDSAAREVAFKILLRGPSELLSNDNIKLVIERSADKSWRARRSCALVLAKVQSPEGQAVAKQQLLRLAKDLHSRVRAASLVALGHIEGAVGSDTMKAIFAAPNERSDRVQMAACVALWGTHKNFDVRPIVPKLLTVLNSTQETFFTLIKQWIEITGENPFPFRKRDKVPFVIQALAAVADLETAELIFDHVLNALRLHGPEEPYYGHILDDNAYEWFAVREVSEKALELRYDDYLIKVSDGKLSFVNYTDQEEFRFEVSNDPIAELVAKLPAAIRTQKVNVLLNDDNNLIKLIGLRIVRSLKDSLDLAVIEESIIRLWADDDRFLRRAAFSTAGLVFADTNQPAMVDALLKQLSIDKEGHEYAWSAIQIVSGIRIVSQYQSSEVN